MKATITHAYVMILVLVSCATPRAAPAAEFVFNTQDFAPFNYAIDGVVSGPAAEVIRRVCKEMGAVCRFKLLPWKRAQEEVRSGKANGMFVIGWNEKRAKWVHFSPPIMKTEYGFFVKADNPMRYDEIADVQGFKVGVYGPSNTANSLNKIASKVKAQGLKPVKVDMRPDDEAGFKKLALGRLDSVFSNREVGFALIAKLNLVDRIRYAGASKSLKYYVGFSQEHNDREALEQFDAAYRVLYDRGVIKGILDRYQMEAAGAQ